ncbi:unnamed protein product [Closterium sp. NIES-53]
MAGAILNAINTRLDARTVALILAHGAARLVMAHRSLAPLLTDALLLLPGLLREKGRLSGLPQVGGAGWCDVGGVGWWWVGCGGWGVVDGVWWVGCGGWEYVAATNASKEGRRFRFLLAEFKLLNTGKPTILRVDNKSAITLAEGLGLTGNLKHMERRYAWLQHMVRRGKFVLKYIPTTEQPADFLTKALHFPAFNRCSVAIGQFRLADVGDVDDDVQQ